MRRKAGHFRGRKVAKQKASQGVEIKLGRLREGKEVSIAGTEKAERKVIGKMGEISQVMGELLSLSETHFPHR